MSEETTQQLPNDLLKLILARLDSMDARLTSLEDKVDRRLQETRLIWEGVLTELKEVNKRLTALENGQKNLRRLFRAAFSDFSYVQEELEERVEKLEGREVPK